MSDENSPVELGRDLFGNPLEPLRDRRGRPCFRKDKQNQDFVAVRAAAGWSQDMIAKALGCDPKTLRKNFSRELEMGRLQVEGMLLDVLLRKSAEGHGPSIKHLQDRLDLVSPPAPKAPKETAPEKPAPKGKKEQRLEDAAQPDDDYGSLYARIPRQ